MTEIKKSKQRGFETPTKNRDEFRRIETIKEIKTR
jgi:hypothetical protein